MRRVLLFNKTGNTLDNWHAHNMTTTLVGNVCLDLEVIEHVPKLHSKSF